MTTLGPGTDPTGDELVLEPSRSAATAAEDRTEATIRVDDATASRIAAAVEGYVETLTALEAQSPGFEQKVGSISRMGNDEIRRSAEASSRFLDRPTAALQRGPLAQGS